MSITTIKTVDKIKLLDQMLEDIAGDEFDDFDTAENAINASVRHRTEKAELDIIETTH